MGKHAQLVMGAAGAGKSTYCSAMVRHCEARKRTVHVVNLDPAAEHFDYPVSIDIRDLISLSDVMSELSYGPNGGLVYALDYFASHLSSFLQQRLDSYSDDYLLFDCPGQIELYTHLDTFQLISRYLQREGYAIVAVYLVDSLFVTDASRLIAGAMMCLSVMTQLELPHINVLTKCDQLSDKSVLERYTDPDIATVLSDLRSLPGLPAKYSRLSEAIGGLLEQYSMVSFLPLDLSDEESIDVLLMHVDNAVQYGEDVEPQEPDDEHEVDVQPGQGDD